MNNLRLVGRILAIMGGVSMIGVTQGIYLNTSKIDSVTTLQDIENKLESKREYLTLFSMIPNIGFGNIKANLIFLDFLQYVGSEAERNKIGYGMSATFFKPIVENDPFFHDFYVFLSGSSSLMAGTPEETIKLMNVGLEKLSPNKPNDSYYIWRYKGVDELLFLNDSPAATVSFRTASEWANESTHPDSQKIANLSKQTAKFLSQNPDSRHAQISAWSSILSTAFDNETRNRAITRIQELGGSVTITEDGSIKVRHAENAQESDI